MSTLRAAFARLLAASLAALAVAGLTAPSAHADTTGERHQIVWNVHSLLRGERQDAYSRYWNMIGALRTAAGHRVGNGVGATERLRSTGARAIEIRLVDNNESYASLYVRSDNLYTMGVWTPSRNSGSVTGLVGFRDQRLEMQAILQRNGTPAPVTDFGFDSTYDALGSYTRASVGMNLYTIADAARAVHGYNPEMTPTQQGGFRAQLIILIQAVSEAARFQDLAITIGENIRTGESGPATRLSTDQVNMENDWSAVSRWLRDALNTPPDTTLATIRFGGGEFDSLEAFNRRFHYTLAKGSFF
ncbi:MULTISPECIES: ribosome-inactivating family protein [Streptomyces]|uniref:ribosome-inactivating family protein n=1 Tax=Streptomyces TaxID=1883 RepID=UPI0006B2A47E|nr:MULTISPECIES: ribosome-inactivating family protein [Streptomyces]KOT62925.1 hypothetical protein ADK43_09055 [Streptomyces rimosus subsp. rimosus]